MIDDFSIALLIIIYLIGYLVRVFYCYKELSVEKDIYLIKYAMNEQSFKTQAFWIAIIVSLIWPIDLVGQLVINIVCWIYNKFNKLVVSKLIKFLDNMIDK